MTFLLHCCFSKLGVGIGPLFFVALDAVFGNWRFTGLIGLRNYRLTRLASRRFLDNPADRDSTRLVLKIQQRFLHHSKSLVIAIKACTRWEMTRHVPEWSSANLPDKVYRSSLHRTCSSGKPDSLKLARSKRHTAED